MAAAGINSLSMGEPVTEHDEASGSGEHGPLRRLSERIGTGISHRLSFTGDRSESLSEEHMLRHKAEEQVKRLALDTNRSARRRNSHFHKRMSNDGEEDALYGSPAFWKVLHKATSQELEKRKEIQHDARMRRHSEVGMIGLADFSKRVTNAPFTFNPNGWKKQFWDWFIISLVVYNAVFIPIDLAFSDHFFTDSTQDNLWAFDTMVDCLFFLDICASFRTQYMDKHGDMVTNPKKLRDAYMKTWFWIDLLATIPFESIGSLFTSNTSQAGALGLLKSIRLFRLGRLLKKLDKLAAANFLRILKLMFGYLLCVHWFACAWYYLAAQLGSDRTWVTLVLDQGHEDNDLQTMYGLAFHWALTTVLPGSGEVLPVNHGERTLSDLVMIMGALMNAFVFGNVAALIQSFDQIQGQYTKQIETVKAFSSHFELDQALQRRMHLFYENSWTVFGGFQDLSNTLGTLPTGLRCDVVAHVYKQLITEEPMFKGCSPGFVRMLVTCLSPFLGVPSEEFIREDDVADDMFFLFKGSAVVVNKDNKYIALLKDPQPIGHIALFKGLAEGNQLGTRTASVLAVELCELARLTFSDLQRCIFSYPDHLDKLMHFAEEDEVRLVAAGKIFRTAMSAQGLGRVVLGGQAADNAVSKVKEKSQSRISGMYNRPSFVGPGDNIVQEGELGTLSGLPRKFSVSNGAVLVPDSSGEKGGGVGAPVEDPSWPPRKFSVSNGDVLVPGAVENESGEEGGGVGAPLEDLPPPGVTEEEQARHSS
mmetsp:Transcript_1329/g.4469  ORF Transcript_1329/g.4469 Transcript_1329/m.4469 type:complete len:762 (-) Transcript_1329:111-2396(-)